MEEALAMESAVIGRCVAVEFIRGKITNKYCGMGAGLSSELLRDVCEGCIDGIGDLIPSEQCQLGLVRAQ
jgi:hypothetical protein